MVLKLYIMATTYNMKVCHELMNNNQMAVGASSGILIIINIKYNIPFTTMVYTVIHGRANPDHDMLVVYLN